MLKFKFKQVRSPTTKVYRCHIETGKPLDQAPASIRIPEKSTECDPPEHSASDESGLASSTESPDFDSYNGERKKYSESTKRHIEIGFYVS